ncbi:unnamed protein product [Schistocephalus solidus]|uniref:Oxidoreductase n=1 Tax=Schistocephalus solidus TaxID=70667 RepID=A0A183SQG9_SCHSO|nr:unnamed protein product [Schistocephalus solidus]
MHFGSRGVTRAASHTGGRNIVVASAEGGIGGGTVVIMAGPGCFKHPMSRDRSGSGKLNCTRCVRDPDESIRSCQESG